MLTNILHSPEKETAVIDRKRSTENTEQKDYTIEKDGVKERHTCNSHSKRKLSYYGSTIAIALERILYHG